MDSDVKFTGLECGKHGKYGPFNVVYSCPLCHKEIQTELTRLRQELTAAREVVRAIKGGTEQSIVDALVAYDKTIGGPYEKTPTSQPYRAEADEKG